MTPIDPPPAAASGRRNGTAADGARFTGRRTGTVRALALC